MHADGNNPLPLLDPGSLRPYVSVLILEGVAGDTEAAYSALTSLLRSPATPQTRKVVTLVADGLPPGTAVEPMDEVLALVHQVGQSPSWQVGGGFVDQRFVLTLAGREGDLIAVLVDRIWADRMQSWLDRPDSPVLRVTDDVLRVAFLRGRAKGLWLKGQHASRANMPDSKAYSGPNLELALNPHTEGSYGVTSGRAELVARPDRRALRGGVGTSPMKGLVWCRGSDSFRDFLDVASDLFDEIRAVRDGGLELDELFPELAVPVHDWAAVNGAFDLGLGAVDDVPAVGVDPDPLIAAAEAIGRLTLEVEGQPESPDFALLVKDCDALVGRIMGHLEVRRRRWLLSLEPVGDDQRIADVRDALTKVRDLLAVRYRSGHSYSNGEMLRRRIRPARFPRWSFRDFASYRVDVEKPVGDVHRNVGEPGDDSLFGWVVGEYATGHLTCDDGSGEVADFVHVAPNGALTVVHVKGATTAGPGRRIAAAPYEQVIGQAMKNLALLESPDLLRMRLAGPRGERAATWHDGQRVTGRSGLLAALDMRDATSPPSQVVAVQPHVQRISYLAALADDGVPPSDDTLRLYLLDSMLNAAAGDVAGAGADLVVIGSDS